MGERTRRWLAEVGAPVWLLLVMAPVCAEYLAAYDESTGDPARLLGGLLFFVPLYGCPALLIREFVRRRGLGWPGVIALAAAFGFVQAGLIDQSLFSTDYRAISDWQSFTEPTLIPGTGLAAYNLVNFVGGHVVYSYCTPMVLAEAVSGARRDAPWLHRPGLIAAALAYVTVSLLILQDHLASEESHASAGQILGTLFVIGLLVALAFLLRPPLHRSRLTDAGAFTVSLAVALVYTFTPPTWAGTAATVVAIAVAGIVVVRHGKGSHTTALAVTGAFVLVRAVSAFTYEPLLGQVDEVAKYAHNVTLLLIVLAAFAWAFRRLTR